MENLLLHEIWLYCVSMCINKKLIGNFHLLSCKRASRMEIAVSQGLLLLYELFSFMSHSHAYLCSYQISPQKAMRWYNFPELILTKRMLFDSILVIGSSLHTLVCNIISSVREDDSPEYVVRSETFTAKLLVCGRSFAFFLQTD